MKLWKIGIVLFWIWSLAFAKLLIDADISKQEQIAEINRELAETRQVIQTVYDNAYDDHNWLAGLATEVDDLKFQDDAFAKLWLRE